MLKNLSKTNMLYGFGAAIVILGALFKIQHWEGGSLLLTIGMITEVLIFTYSAFEKKTEEIDESSRTDPYNPTAIIKAQK
jgi:gliding motility-associated protein GldL